VTLKDIMWVFNVRKLQRPSISNAFLTSYCPMLYNSCGVQWIAQSVSQPRKTCVADALFLCRSWTTCHFWPLLADTRKI